MFGLFSPKVIPAAREVSVAVALGLKRLEFARERKIESDLNTLRDHAHAVVQEMLKTSTKHGFLALREWTTKECDGPMFEQEAIFAVAAELRALGYEIRIWGKSQDAMDIDLPEQGKRSA